MAVVLLSISLFVSILPPQLILIEVGKVNGFTHLQGIA